MCCTRLAGNTGRKILRKNRHLRTIAQLCWAIWLHILTLKRKVVKQQYLLHMSLQHGERRPTNDWDRFGSLGHRSKFQRVSRLGIVTALTSLNGGQPNFAQCLAVSWAGTLYIYILGLLPLREFCHVQNSLCVQVLRSRILAALLYRARAQTSAKLCGVVSLRDRAAIPFNIGRPNFLAWVCFISSFSSHVYQLGYVRMF